MNRLFFQQYNLVYIKRYMIQYFKEEPIKISTRQEKCREKGQINMNAAIEKMRKDGYPYKIRRNDGHPATLYNTQPLNDGDNIAIIG